MDSQRGTLFPMQMFCACTKRRLWIQQNAQSRGLIKTNIGKVKDEMYAIIGTTECCTTK